MLCTLRRAVLACASTLALTLSAPHPLAAQATAASREVIAVADTVLRALSTNDTATLRRLSLDSTIVGGVGLRNGAEVETLRSMRTDITRGLPSFVERGFTPVAQVGAWVATVWMPYDLYRSGTWSHCGVDVFTLVRRNGSWRVASLLYSIEQPPACAKHPDGPPR